MKTRTMGGDAAAGIAECGEAVGVGGTEAITLEAEADDAAEAATASEDTAEAGSEGGAGSDDSPDNPNDVDKTTERQPTSGEQRPETKYIYSARVLERAAEDPGPYHDFPGSFDEQILYDGSRTIVEGYFQNDPRPYLSSDTVQYTLTGTLNGRSGTYEVFTRPSASGRTELIVHRFFRPN